VVRDVFDENLYADAVRCRSILAAPDDVPAACNEAGRSGSHRDSRSAYRARTIRATIRPSVFVLLEMPVD
jgi:hypothetical protein